MKQIGEFLIRFKHLGLNERLSKEALVEEINLILGFGTVSNKDISIKNQTAFIKGASALKSEISLNKEIILAGARKKAGVNFVVTDMR